MDLGTRTTRPVSSVTSRVLESGAAGAVLAVSAGGVDRDCVCPNVAEARAATVATARTHAAHRVFTTGFSQRRLRKIVAPNSLRNAAKSVFWSHANKKAPRE